MDVRGSERLSMAQRADADRMVGTSILLTLVVATVLGVSAGVLLMLAEPAIATSLLGLLAIAGASAGLVGVQALHVWQLETPGRWGAPVGVDAALMALVAGLFLFGHLALPVAVVAAAVLHSVGRVMARSAALVTSWEVAVEDSQVRFRRLVFSVPRGPWHSVSLETAFPRVMTAGRDAYLEIGGVLLPVGAEDELAAMLAQEIELAAVKRARNAEDERPRDRQAVEAMVRSTGVAPRIRTYTPTAIEAFALGIAAALALPVLLAQPPVGAVALFIVVVALRSGAWLYGRRLAQRFGAWPAAW